MAEIHRHVSGSLIETLPGGEGHRFKGEDAPVAPATKFDWVPLAERRLVDIPVQASNGGTYYVISFDLPLERQVAHLLTVRAKAGSRRTTRAQVEEAIERLRAFAAEIKE